MCSFLGGCADLQTTGGGSSSGRSAWRAQKNSSEVTLVNSFSATDATQFDELGPVTCQLTRKSLLKHSPEESCRNDLRIYGARMGADVVLIEENQRMACDEPKPDADCVFMKGRAYARKQSSSSSSGTGYSPSVVDSAPRPPEHAKGAHFVQIVHPLSTEEARHCTSVGTVDCSAEWYLGLRDTHEQLCQEKLQSEAFKKGADVIVVDTKEVVACRNSPGPYDGGGPCVKMTATGFRKSD